MITCALELNLPAPLLTELNKCIMSVFDVIFGISACHFNPLYIYLCAFGSFDARFSTGRSPEKSRSNRIYKLNMIKAHVKS